MKLDIIIITIIFCSWVSPSEAPSSLIIDGFGVSSNSYREVYKNKSEIPFESNFITSNIPFYQFVNDQLYKDEIANCTSDLQRLWTSNDNSELSQEDFNKLWQEKDPFCWGIIKNSAPNMFFNFRGEEDKVYYLDSIVVEVIDYIAPKPAGGYVNMHVDADIFLTENSGNKISICPSPKMYFEGRGTAELTFWSEHYYNLSLDKPPTKATYFLNIKFLFSDDEGNTITLPKNQELPFIIQV